MIEQKTTKTIKTVQLGNIGKLIIPEDVKAIVDQLHRDIGAIEWSGVLFYDLVDGDISTLKDLVFKAKLVYPLDIGSASYTEFDGNGDLTEAYKMDESLYDCENGLIHTHHSMSTFFSSTDISELEDNSKHYNYYLSLIVNFDGKWNARLGIPSVSKNTTDSMITDSNGKKITISKVSEKEELLMGTIEVEIEKDNIEYDWVTERVNAMKKAKEDSLKKENLARTNATNRYYLNHRGGYSTDTKKKEEKEEKNKNSVNIQLSTGGRLKHISFLGSVITSEYSEMATPWSAISELNNICHSTEEYLDPMEEDIDLLIYTELVMENIPVLYTSFYPEGEISFIDVCTSALKTIATYKRMFDDRNYHDAIVNCLTHYITEKND